MLMRVTFLLLIVSLVVFIAVSPASVQAQVNELFVYPSAQTVNQGGYVTIEIRGKAPVGVSDVYAIQYDVDYNDSILSFVSIAGGNLLNNNSQDVTFFNYSLAPGKIDDVYIVRNETNGTDAGIHMDLGNFTIINFTTIAPGISYINISELTWVNSSITNESVGVVENVIVTNGTVNVNPVYPPSINNIDCQIDDFKNNRSD